jgi:polysaccharide biosynthesis transport protein
MRSDGESGTPNLAEHVRVLTRRKWLVLAVAVLSPVLVVAFSLQRDKLYRASAEVLVSNRDLGAMLTGTESVAVSDDPDRTIETQAELARVPTVATRALRAVGIRRDVESFLEDSSVSPKQNADLLVFEVTDPDPRLAVDLATAFARQFTIYRRELDTAALVRARQEVQRQIRSMRGRARRSVLYETLVEKEQQLGTLAALQTSNAFVVRRPTKAKQVQPRPLRDGALGAALGLVFGIGVAFLRDRLDSRVRTTEQASETLGLPLLARLPGPPRSVRRNDDLVTLTEPDRHHAEAFRILRTNLEFSLLEREVKTILVTSAVEREGKSTTAANLAVALARAGRSVALVDLDLRRAYLHRFFGLNGQAGLTDVALGRAWLDEALADVSIPASTPKGGGFNGSNGLATPGNVLRVLTTGPLPPDVGDFISTNVLAEILEALKERVDLVLIDAPPLLHVGDAIALAARVDAVLVVARLGVVTRPMLREVRRLLTAAPAAKLGFVATGAKQGEEYGYAGYDYYELSPSRVGEQT